MAGGDINTKTCLHKIFLLIGFFVIIVLGKSYLTQVMAGEATFYEVKMSNILSSCQAKSENNVVAIFVLAEFMAPV